MPMVYDGRNRSFFFFSFDGTRQRNLSSPGWSTLPTAAFKRGDFSKLDPAFSGIGQSGTALGVEGAGRQVQFGQIFVPASTGQVGSAIVRDPSPGQQAEWN